MATGKITFDSTLWTFDNNLQVTFDIDGQDICVGDFDSSSQLSVVLSSDVDTVTNIIKANFPITFDSTIWTFDNDLHVTFDSDGQNLHVNNFYTMAVKATPLSDDIDTLGIVSTPIASSFDTYSVVSLFLVDNYDVKSIVSIHALFSADTKSIAWIANIPTGTAFFLIFGNDKIFIPGYFGSQDGSLVLYQAEEISTGGDKFGYSSRNSDNNTSVSLQIDETSKDDLLDFFSNSVNGMTGVFILGDNIDYTIKNVRFAQPNIEVTESDGLFSVSFELKEA